ncbi:ABC transporter ATP-binding protein [Glycomyces xiaoerkulensis]|uniref:ABC transporter ATP-binding protein n=1 Tax=Glycomyces xiaoerkulensis TaxID=2038139 RepID=UPI0018E467C3|nr:ATP-binding cassette domain-containing protein [Glycomyces xiaoerkulensis]
MVDDPTLNLPRIEAERAAVPELIELRGLAMTYPGPPPVEVLKPVDLRVRVGEYVAIVGPSGSGKSTLLNLLGMLGAPTSGTYLLDGHDTSTLKESARTRLRAEKIGFIFQAFHLMAHRSATENVAMSLVCQGVPHGRRKAIARAKLELVGLGHRLEAVPTTLSGAGRQRVAIARASRPSPRSVVRRADWKSGFVDRRCGAGHDR